MRLAPGCSQFAAWFQRAASAGVGAPEAAALATVSTDGVPSVRMVLMKQYDERGFVFYSNYESRKGEELEANPHAALLFYWELLGRQVRIEGGAERTAPDESAAYVRGRPRDLRFVRGLVDSADLPLLDAWGGFRVVSGSFELWQHRADRLHDRLRYTRGDDGRWRVQRLAP